jgi:large subunit ribosomal protein L29
MTKASEVRDLPVGDIEDRLTETKEELFNLRFQHATGQLDNYRRLRELRREVARLKTILWELHAAGTDPSDATGGRR